MRNYVTSGSCTVQSTFVMTFSTFTIHCIAFHKLLEADYLFFRAMDPLKQLVFIIYSSLLTNVIVLFVMTIQAQIAVTT